MVATRSLQAFSVLLVRSVFLGQVITGAGIAASTAIAANTTAQSVEAVTVTYQSSTIIFTGTQAPAGVLPTPYPNSHCMIVTQDSAPLIVCLKPFIDSPPPNTAKVSTVSNTVAITTTVDMVYLSEVSSSTITKKGGSNLALSSTGLPGYPTTSIVATTQTHTSGCGYSKANLFKPIIGAGKHIFDLSKSIHTFYSRIHPRLAITGTDHLLDVHRFTKELFRWVKSVLFI
ncbi:hypothetical protein B7463_g8624, partial [Scytalidium lignicola]